VKETDDRPLASLDRAALYGKIAEYLWGLHESKLTGVSGAVSEVIAALRKLAEEDAPCQTTRCKKNWPVGLMVYHRIPAEFAKHRARCVKKVEGR
jgi:hypothetical protein